MITHIGNNVNIPMPVTLIATALPGSLALRVPYDNVSPSVSSSQLDNNASSNNNYLPTANVPPNAAGDYSPEITAVQLQLKQSTYNTTAQTGFLAQLAAGEISPEVRGLFAQYDKLVSYANVKYKPSNAGKPSEPVSMFKTLLQIEQESQSHDTPISFPQPPQKNTASDIPKTEPISFTQAENIEHHTPQTAHKQRSGSDYEKFYKNNIQFYSSVVEYSNYTSPTNIELA